MKLLFTLIITLCIIMLAQNNLRKHASIWYCTAFLLSLGYLLLPSSAPVILIFSFVLIVIPFFELSETSRQSMVIVDESVATANGKTPSSPLYKDGTWTGTALGYNDEISVSVTISDGKIVDISIIESYDDEPYYDWAKNEIPQSIIAAQSTDIDTVSGATFSSEGIINAVVAALENARQ